MSPSLSPGAVLGGLQATWQPYADQVQVRLPPDGAEQDAEFRDPRWERCPELLALVQRTEHVRHGHVASGEVQANCELGGFISGLFGQFLERTEERCRWVPPDPHVGA